MELWYYVSFDYGIGMEVIACLPTVHSPFGGVEEENRIRSESRWWSAMQENQNAAGEGNKSEYSFVVKISGVPLTLSIRLKPHSNAHKRLILNRKTAGYRHPFILSRPLSSRRISSHTLGMMMNEYDNLINMSSMFSVDTPFQMVNNRISIVCCHNWACPKHKETPTSSQDIPGIVEFMNIHHVICILCVCTSPPHMKQLKGRPNKGTTAYSHSHSVTA